MATGHGLGRGQTYGIMLMVIAVTEYQRLGTSKKEVCLAHSVGGSRQVWWHIPLTPARGA